MNFQALLNRFLPHAAGAAVLLAASAARGDTLYSWSASSGLFPNQVTTSTGFAPVTLTDTASPEDPALTGGALQIATDQYAENMYYLTALAANGDEASLGQLPLSIEFTLKMGTSGTSDSLMRRAGVVVAFSDGGAGNGLQITDSEFFISNATFSRGAGVSKTTTDAFHTYRIDIGGYAAGSSYAVYFDNALQFSGSLYASTSDNGPTNGPVQVYFGEASSLAFGSSQFQSFRIATVPEPTTWVWLGAAALAGGGRILARRACIGRRLGRWFVSQGMAKSTPALLP